MHMASMSPPTMLTTYGCGFVALYELFIYQTEIDVLGLKLDFD